MIYWRTHRIQSAYFRPTGHQRRLFSWQLVRKGQTWNLEDFFSLSLQQVAPLSHLFSSNISVIISNKSCHHSSTMDTTKLFGLDYVKNQEQQIFRRQLRKLENSQDIYNFCTHYTKTWILCHNLILIVKFKTWFNE